MKRRTGPATLPFRRPEGTGYVTYEVIIPPSGTALRLTVAVPTEGPHARDIRVFTEPAGPRAAFQGIRIVAETND